MIDPAAATPCPTQVDGARAVGRRWVDFGMAFLAAVMLVAMLGEAILRPMYFDERAHLNNLWLITQGLHPYRDFLCTYPAAGYAPFLPIFRLLPVHASALLILRLYSVFFVVASVVVLCVWSWRLCRCWWVPLLPALLAITAIGGQQEGLARVLSEFRPDSPALLMTFLALALLWDADYRWNRILAWICTVVSFALMPKYIYVLAACHAGDIIHCAVTRRLNVRVILSNIVGVLLGALADWGLTAFALANPVDSWRWSYAMQEHYQAHVMATADDGKTFFSTQLVPFLADNLLLWVCLVAGLGAFLFWARKNHWRGQRVWMGGGLLVGVIVTVVRTQMPFNQYLPPVILPLLFLFPFLGFWLARRQRPTLIGGLVLTATLAQLLVVAHYEVTSLSRLELFNDIIVEDQMQFYVPENERVLGTFTLVFRRPLTYLTYDEIRGQPSGFSPVVESDLSMEREFSPDRLLEALRLVQPAIIAPSVSFPPGWTAIMDDYLAANHNSYQRLELRGKIIYIRTDLVSTPSPISQLSAAK